MSSFLSSSECRIDAKGRFMLPAAIKKKLSKQDTFVLNYSLDKCIDLYTYNEWESYRSDIYGKVDRYNEKHRGFVRKLLGGASELTIDGNNRLLLPKNFLDYAQIKNDIVLVPLFNKIEIWSKALNDKLRNDSSMDMSKVAFEILGKQNLKDGIS